MKKDGYLMDEEGRRSSKRLWGSILMGFAVLFSTVLFFYCLSHKVDSHKPLFIIEYILMAGSGLLGISVVTNFKKK